MRGKLVSTLLPFLLLLAPAMGNPLAEIEELEKRQSSCPKVHVFGARETTAPAGYGTSQNVVNSVLSAYSGSNAEAINYPACGGQSSCGGVSYANSVVQGITAVANAVNSYNQKCPNTVLVLIGYSQVGTSVHLMNFSLLSAYALLFVYLCNNNSIYRADKLSMMLTAVAVTPMKVTPILPSQSRLLLRPRLLLPS